MPSTEPLILIPTELERTILARSDALDGLAATVALCGFGIAAAAARTAQLIATHSPQRVLLIGIAGTYDEDLLPVGQAHCFQSVAIDGIGCGQGAHYQSSATMGFEHWPEQEIGDRIELSTPSSIASSELLLTCCATSATDEEADLRRGRFPGAKAEDMEGFGVAIACVMSETPLAIVRGISNRVADREQQNWQVQQALLAAGGLVRTCLRSDLLWEKPR